MPKFYQVGVLFVTTFLFTFPSFAKSPGLKGCDLEFKKTKYCGKIEWIIPPKSVEMVTEKDKSEFILNIIPEKASSKQFNSNYNVSVKLFMPSMGHGSHPTQVIQEVDQAGNKIQDRYRVKNVYFTMPGDWEIRVDLKRDGKIIDSAISSFVLK
jgi:hypothetical protein